MMKRFKFSINSRIKIVLCIFSIITSLHLNGQPISELTLKDAYVIYADRYPSIKNSKLLDEIYEQELRLLDINRLPGIFLKSDARLQSETIGMNPEPGIPSPFAIDIPLYSFKTYVEAQYNIYDGGYSLAQKKLKKYQLEANLQGVELEKYKLKNQINQLCIHIQLLREQINLLDISNNNLIARKENLLAAVENGVALETELAKLEVKEIELLALKEDAIQKKIGLTAVLSKLLGLDLSESVQFIFPEFSSNEAIPPLQRPELKLFQLKSEALLAKSDLIEAQKKPVLNAIAQTGFGIPDPLNFFDNELSPFGIIGASFSWRITDWSRSKKERKILSLEAMKIQHEKESFELNMDALVPEYLAEVSRIKKQMGYDLDIAQLQKKILTDLSAQLDEGVITSTEYILQLNAELQARQNLIIHQTQLLQTHLEFWNVRGVL